MQEYKLHTDAAHKATELAICRISGSVEQNPHVRGFWAATISFFLAFWGLFALAPLSLEVAHSMGICENQLYPSEQYPTRRAFIAYENAATGEGYCQYGKTADEQDCEGVPAETLALEECNSTEDNTTRCATKGQLLKYAHGVLAKCVCTAGTRCRTTLSDADTISVVSTILARIALGTILERFGPVNVQTALVTIGGVCTASAAAITAPWNFILIRFLSGIAGASFVVNQFWCSLMFAPNVVGTANATAAGWGNLGGGVMQAVMVVGLFGPLVSLGTSDTVAWRVSMLVPAVLCLLMAFCMKRFCWDTPLGKRLNPLTHVGKPGGPSMSDYLEVFKSSRAMIMTFQYSACFGTEVAMNNRLATHFRTYFQLKASNASLLAASFGGMNIFARSLGGIASDVLFMFVGFRGRIWAQFLALFFEAIFLYGFGTVTNDQPLSNALAVLICFSLFVQMAEGTSYGIVPFISKTQLACVTAVVGAGGNLGAVIAGFGFYRTSDNPLTPFKVHAAYVMFWALLSPLYYWPEHGGMFCGPAGGHSAEGNLQGAGIVL